ncbi:MAG: efflux RND transporter periplasmic adaptor subunit [Tepidisphaeraceae bacterium]
MRFSSRCAVLLPIVLAASFAVAQMGPAQVFVAPVEKRSVELTAPLVATVEAVTYTTLAAEQEGLVDERLFDEGQKVEKGQVLVRVDTELLKIQRDAAEAARLAIAAELKQAQAEVDNANRERDRIAEMRQTNVAQEKEYRDAVTDAEIAIAKVAQKSAEQAEKKAEVDRLSLMITKADVKAPIAGVIAKRHAEVGQWIKQGDAVAELVQLDPLWVRTAVPEEAVQRVRKGDEATVMVDALGGKTFAGKVDQILPVADQASRTVWVKILVPNPDGSIMPGFFARATLSSSTSDASLLVPKDALVPQGERVHVAVVRDGKAVLVPVTRGPSHGEKIVVIGELSEKDQVIVRGNEGLRGGEDVIVLNAPPATAPPGAEAPQGQQGG